MRPRAPVGKRISAVSQRSTPPDVHRARADVTVGTALVAHLLRSSNGLSHDNHRGALTLSGAQLDRVTQYIADNRK